jgi:hypothetical protein
VSATSSRGITKSAKFSHEEAQRVSRAAQQASAMMQSVVTISDVMRQGTLERAARIDEKFNQHQQQKGHTSGKQE